MQQTFLACIEARERYQGDASFKTFLLAIARNQLSQHYSTAPARARLRADLCAPTSTLRRATLVARREDERLLAEALRRVPLEAQVVLELAFWEGFDGMELARVLEVPLNTAYSRLRRAKFALASACRTRAEDVTFLRASSYDRTFTKGEIAMQ